jgi:hypothetical protein
LRIARNGTEAVLSAAEVGKEFATLFHVPLGTEDVTRIRVGVNPRGARFVDLRLLDLNIKGRLLASAKK